MNEHKHAIEMIEHYRVLIIHLHEDIAKHQRQMQGHIDSLPRLYYLEMTGYNGYEKGIRIAGTCDDVYNYVSTVLLNEITEFDDFNGHLKGSRLEKSCQIYPRLQGFGNAQPRGVKWYKSGMVKFCTPLNDIWNEVYALSSKEGE